jgi:hypothetical protein
MSAVAAIIFGGGIAFALWLVVHLLIVARPPRGNRCLRKGKNILPPPSPACERTFRLAER